MKDKIFAILLVLFSCEPVASLPEFKVSFVDGAGKIHLLTVESGDKVNLPILAKDNFTFAGWYTDFAFTTKFTPNTPISKDTVLYAKWTRNIVTVSFAIVNSIELPSIQVAAGNAIIKFPNVSETHKKLSDWYTDEKLTTKFASETPIIKPITLYTKLIDKIYNISLEHNGGKGAKSIKVTANNLLTKPASTRADYRLDGWYTDIFLKNKFAYNTAITADKTLYAKWIPYPATKDKLWEIIYPLINPKMGGSAVADLNHIDTSQITDMSELFSSAKWSNTGKEPQETKDKIDSFRKFNGHIAKWKVENVTNMEKMFKEARGFNQSLEFWNTSKVTNMKEMFYNAINFNQNLIDVLGNTSWKVSNVTNMKQMFHGARSFNQSLTLWNVSSVTTPPANRNNINNIFHASGLDHVPLHWPRLWKNLK